jgi:hypothetical protein
MGFSNPQGKPLFSEHRSSSPVPGRFPALRVELARKFKVKPSLIDHMTNRHSEAYWRGENTPWRVNTFPKLRVYYEEERCSDPQRSGPQGPLSLSGLQGWHLESAYCPGADPGSFVAQSAAMSAQTCGSSPPTSGGSLALQHSLHDRGPGNVDR